MQDELIMEHDTKPVEVLTFSDKESMIVASKLENLFSCNTYFDPIKGWVLEKPL